MRINGEICEEEEELGRKVRTLIRGDFKVEKSEQEFDVRVHGESGLTFRVTVTSVRGNDWKTNSETTRVNMCTFEGKLGGKRYELG